MAIDRRPPVGVDRLERNDERGAAGADFDRPADGSVGEPVHDLHQDGPGR
jgi:hypothetical protein